MELYYCNLISGKICDAPHNDFCECVKNSLKESKDKKINETLLFLKKNNILYQSSKIPNIIQIIVSEKKVFMSLKKYRGFFKIRFENSNTWCNYSPNKFLEHFCQKADVLT